MYATVHTNSLFVQVVVSEEQCSALHSMLVLSKNVVLAAGASLSLRKLPSLQYLSTEGPGNVTVINSECLLWHEHFSQYSDGSQTTA